MDSNNGDKRLRVYTTATSDSNSIVSISKSQQLTFVDGDEIRLSDARSDSARKILRASNLAKLEMAFEQDMPLPYDMNRSDSNQTAKVGDTSGGDGEAPSSVGNPPPMVETVESESSTSDDGPTTNGGPKTVIQSKPLPTSTKNMLPQSGDTVISLEGRNENVDRYRNRGGGHQQASESIDFNVPSRNSQLTHSIVNPKIDESAMSMPVNLYQSMTGLQQNIPTSQQSRGLSMHYHSNGLILDDEQRNTFDGKPQSFTRGEEKSHMRNDDQENLPRADHGQDIGSSRRFIIDGEEINPKPNIGAGQRLDTRRLHDGEEFSMNAYRAGLERGVLLNANDRRFHDGEEYPRNTGRVLGLDESAHLSTNHRRVHDEEKSYLATGPGAGLSQSVHVNSDNRKTNNEKEFPFVTDSRARLSQSAHASSGNRYNDEEEFPLATDPGARLSQRLHVNPGNRRSYGGEDALEAGLITGLVTGLASENRRATYNGETFDSDEVVIAGQQAETRSFTTSEKQHTKFVNNNLSNTMNEERRDINQISSATDSISYSQDTQPTGNTTSGGSGKNPNETSHSQTDSSSQEHNSFYSSFTPDRKESISDRRNSIEQSIFEDSKMDDIRRPFNGDYEGIGNSSSGNDHTPELGREGSYLHDPPPQSRPQFQSQSSSWRPKPPSAWTQEERMYRFICTAIFILLLGIIFLLALYLPGSTFTTPRQVMTAAPTLSPTIEVNTIGKLYEIASKIIIESNVSKKEALGRGGCSWYIHCRESKLNNSRGNFNRTIGDDGLVNRTIHQKALLRCVMGKELLGNSLRDHILNLSVVEDDVVRQCYIINVFGLSLGMNFWKDKQGWISSFTETDEPADDEINICDWHGIECDDGAIQRVIGIDLPDNNLNGELPPELFELPKLKSVKLYTNIIGGNITGIASARSLEEFSLQSNERGDLKGSIPTEIGLLTNMKRLYLGNNKLDGRIPTEVGKLTKLEQFSVYNNSLTGPFPSELKECKKLKRIFLDSNDLTGSIPTDFAYNFESLTDFRINYNRIDGLFPRSFMFLSDLRVLYIDHNEFSGQIPPLSDWSTMEHFDASMNSFSGTIPTKMFNFPELLSLSLMGNNINSTIPDKICAYSKKLEKLDLSKNSLTGEVPDSLTNCDNLKDLNLSHNMVTGTINKLLCNKAEEIIVDCKKVDCSCCKC